MRENTFFYDGDWQQPCSSETYAVKDPATGELIGNTPLANATDVDQAVKSATRVQPEWANAHPDERALIIHRAANLIEEKIELIAELLTREQGKPIADSRKEIEFGIRVLHYYAEEGRRIRGELRPSMSEGIKSIVSYYPIGVAGAIVPWNYPVDIYCWKIGPALAAGCPIIIKPPHETPFAIGEVVSCFHKAGLPAGVLANLPGTGPDAGVALSQHPAINLLSATASIAAGQDITRKSAVNLKRLSLELGGHAPFIVLPDADIESSASAAMRRSFSNMGQICITVNRVLVHQDVHTEFVDILTAKTKAIKLGHGINPQISYGPTLNHTVIARTEQHISDALAKGGKLITGGERVAPDGMDQGHFFRPTLIDNAPLNSLPMMKESYGPLAAIRAYQSMDELLDIANGLPYGLAAYVYSADLEQAWGLADKLETGAVGININDTTELQAPFGGWKLSGVGSELGPEGLQAFLQPKHIKIRVKKL